MTKFFFNSKTPIFGPFPQFWGQKVCQKNRVVIHNSISVPSALAKFRENTQMSGGKNGQSLIGFLQLPSGG